MSGVRARVQPSRSVVPRATRHAAFNSGGSARGETDMSPATHELLILPPARTPLAPLAPARPLRPPARRDARRDTCLRLRWWSQPRRARRWRG